MTLKIISAQDTLFQGEVTAVHLPGVNGAFTVLKNHAALVSALNPGLVRYNTPDGAEESAEISGGIADIADNVISVCIY